MSTNHYVDKKELLELIAAYQNAVKTAKENGTKIPKMPDSIGLAIKKTVEGVARRPNFRKYTFLQDMIGDAIEDCVRSVLKFDTSHVKQNPFGYFSRCAWYAFVEMIKSEADEQQAVLDSMFDPNMDAWSTIEGDSDDYGNASNKSEILDFYYGGKLS